MRAVGSGSEFDQTDPFDEGYAWTCRCQRVMSCMQYSLLRGPGQTDSTRGARPDPPSGGRRYANPPGQPTIRSLYGFRGLTETLASYFSLFHKPVMRSSRNADGVLRGSCVRIPRDGLLPGMLHAPARRRFRRIGREGFVLLIHLESSPPVTGNHPPHGSAPIADGSGECHAPNSRHVDPTPSPLRLSSR